MPTIRSLLPCRNRALRPRARPHGDRTDEELLPTSVKLFRKDIEYHLPLPGEHNLENLCAALCVCEHFGCEGPTLADAVKNL